MKKALAILVIGVVFVFGVVLQAQDKKPKGKEDVGEAKKGEDVSAELKKKVNQAIEKGVKYLKSQQRSNGQWAMKFGESFPGGTTSLVLLALLKSGVSPDDECIKKGFEFVQSQTMKKVYSVGIYLMAIDALYEAKEKEKFPDTGQTKVYRKRKIKPKGKRKREMKKYTKWLISRLESYKANLYKIGVIEGYAWRYPGNLEPNDKTPHFDTSNCQYALFGLRASARCGIRVSAKVWTTALEHLLNVQARAGKERGWGYQAPWANMIYGTEKKTKWLEATCGSMTTAGVACLTICMDELKHKRKLASALKRRTEEGIKDGISWLAKYFTVLTNPAGPREDRKPGMGYANLFYYLFGLERVGVLCNIKKIGAHDWYEEGARLLVKVQKPDGSWLKGGETHADVFSDTCFALLFLKKATVPVITGSGRGEEPGTSPGKKK